MQKMTSKLKHILGLIALVLMFASCSKDSEMFTSPCDEEYVTTKSLSHDDPAPGESDSSGLASSDEDNGTDPDSGDGISDDDDDDDDDDDGSVKKDVPQ